MDNIRGKTIAITGAARGIGFATAKALLARGARVVIGDRDVALQESAVAGLTKLGPASGYPLDVTDRESFATFLDKARTDGGGHIDVLINLGGTVPAGYERFARVAEFLDARPEVRAAGRERFKTYRGRSIEPQTHNVGSS